MKTYLAYSLLLHACAGCHTAALWHMPSTAVRLSFSGVLARAATQHFGTYRIEANEQDVFSGFP